MIKVILPCFFYTFVCTKKLSMLSLKPNFDVFFPSSVSQYRTGEGGLGGWQDAGYVSTEMFLLTMTKNVLPVSLAFTQKQDLAFCNAFPQ